MKSRAPEFLVLAGSSLSTAIRLPASARQSRMPPVKLKYLL
jgi:hypothetical protein